MNYLEYIYYRDGVDFGDKIHFEINEKILYYGGFNNYKIGIITGIIDKTNATNRTRGAGKYNYLVEKSDGTEAEFYAGAIRKIRIKPRYI